MAKSKKELVEDVFGDGIKIDVHKIKRRNVFRHRPTKAETPKNAYKRKEKYKPDWKNY